MKRPLIFALSVAAALSLGACEQKKGLSVEKVEPASGVSNGGDTVQIIGSGFEPGKTQVEVRFGRSRAENVMISSTNKITVVTPAGAKGPVDVSLMFDNGAPFKIPNGFRYQDPSAGTDVRKAFFSGKPGETPPAAK